MKKRGLPLEEAPSRRPVLPPHVEQGTLLRQRRQEFHHRIATLTLTFNNFSSARNEKGAEEEAREVCDELGNLYPDAKEHYPERQAVRLALQYAEREFPGSRKLKALLKSLQ